MIICGFPGVGKSTLIEKNPDWFVDLDSSLFAKDKDGKPNETFELDYIKAIREQLELGKIVLTSTHIEMLRRIERNNWDFTIVIPSSICCDEYLLRYKNRGNSVKMMQYIYDNWEKWLSDIKNEFDNYIELKPGQFLSDVVLFKTA